MSIPTCRICLEENKNFELISPCKCSGTSAWVHRECLESWRMHDVNNSSSRCTECLVEYTFDNITPGAMFYIFSFAQYCTVLLVSLGTFLAVSCIFCISTYFLSIFLHVYAFQEKLLSDSDAFLHSLYVALVIQTLYTTFVMFVYWESRSYGEKFPFHAFSIFSFPFIAMIYLGSITMYNIQQLVNTTKQIIERKRKLEYRKVKCLHELSSAV